MCCYVYFMTQTNPKDIHCITYQLTSVQLDINHVCLRYGSYLVENPISLVIQEGEWLSGSIHYWMLRAYQEL
jgi:hypothetical protein